jgi:flagellar hook-associated protein 1 FlgK
LGTVNSQIDIHRSDDLLDQRDVLIMELSEKIDVHIAESETGSVEVLSGGHILVSEDFVNQLKLKLSQKQNGSFKAEIKTIQGEKNLNIKSGEIGGLLEFHNDHISRFIQSIDKLAVSLANAINEFHVEGYNLKGLSGWNFFNDSVSGAGDISLTPEILSDASLISTSSDSSAQGNGSVAQSIADLQYDGIVEEKTISDQYNTIIADVGNRVQEATFIRQNQEKIVSQLHIKKASISGVSLDEEMTQLIQYEQAYEASARMISTIDELMQTILSMG